MGDTVMAAYAQQGPTQTGLCIVPITRTEGNPVVATASSFQG